MDNKNNIDVYKHQPPLQTSSIWRAADKVLLNHIIMYRTLIIITPAVVFALIVLLSPVIINVGKSLPSCLFHSVTGIYCLTCGVTRSVVALLNGDILLCFKNSILIPIGMLLLFALYIKWLAHAFGKKIFLFLNKPAFWYILGILLISFLILRNFFPILCPESVNW